MALRNYRSVHFETMKKNPYVALPPSIKSDTCLAVQDVELAETELSKTQLVGGIPTPLKNIKVHWDYYSQYMEN